MMLSDYRSFQNGMFKQERNQLSHDQRLFLSVEKTTTTKEYRKKGLN